MSARGQAAAGYHVQLQSQLTNDSSVLINHPAPMNCSLHVCRYTEAHFHLLVSLYVRHCISLQAFQWKMSEGVIVAGFAWLFQFCFCFCLVWERFNVLEDQSEAVLDCSEIWRGFFGWNFRRNYLLIWNGRKASEKMNWANFDREFTAGLENLESLFVSEARLVGLGTRDWRGRFTGFHGNLMAPLHIWLIIGCMWFRSHCVRLMVPQSSVSVALF